MAILRYIPIKNLPAQKVQLVGKVDNEINFQWLLFSPIEYKVKNNDSKQNNKPIIINHLNHLQSKIVVVKVASLNG